MPRVSKKIANAHDGHIGGLIEQVGPGFALTPDTYPYCEMRCSGPGCQAQNLGYNLEFIHGRDERRAIKSPNKEGGFQQSPPTPLGPARDAIAPGA